MLPVRPTSRVTQDCVAIPRRGDKVFWNEELLHCIPSKRELEETQHAEVRKAEEACNG